MGATVIVCYKIIKNRASDSRRCWTFSWSVELTLQLPTSAASLCKATQRLDSATNSVVLLFFCFACTVNIKVLTNIFPFLFYSFSPSKEKEQANVCKEKSDLRLCHGFHHQCHAYRSQSNAAKWHGVTPCTVSIGSGQNSHDLTSSLSLQPKLDEPQPKHVSKQSIKLFYFTVN